MVANSSKRRRNTDGDDDVHDTQQEGKRVKSLPFRTSPTSKQSNLYSQHHIFVPQSLAPALTPLDSSDDDCGLPSLSDSTTASDSSTSSTRVVVGDEDDVHMLDSQPRGTFSSPYPCQGRSRSNDMLAPPQFPHLLSSQDRNGGRVATPMYGHFNNPDVDMNASNRGPSPSALLSPLIHEEEESEWCRPRRLPTPYEDCDELMTPVGEAGGMMNRLNFNTLASEDVLAIDDPTTSRPDHGLPMFQRCSSVSEGQSTGHRSTRLTMGYRADCEKCVQKVPGHYSHIVRG